MSVPAKKKSVRRQKKAEESKRPIKEKAVKPTGVPPFAVVEVRHAGRTVTRHARGYSPGEVAQGGMDVGLARSWGVHVDDMRRSVLGANVASLKKWVPRAKKTTEQKVEGEVRKMERAVEEEFHKVEKEVSKVEKEVVEKVEAPVKKRSKKATAKDKPT